MSYDVNMWNSVLSELQRDPNRINEMNSKCIACQNNQSLRWYEKVIGSPTYSGYALFICLHGGGHGAASMNDSQWKDIIPFESGGFTNGTIAVAPRGINNEWNLHFIDESYPALTRLIEDYIIFRSVDPNRVYLIGFSAGGDGTYQLSERIPYLFAACSPQGGHPNNVSTINICNLPTYLAAGEKDTAFKRNQVCVDYYNQIVGQNGKYLGNYIAKVEVVAGSGHSFQCWKKPRRSFFNGSKNVSTSNETAFDFMYSHIRNPFPVGISLDTNCFLTKLRNYYTPRGNTFYNIEVGKNPSPIIQVQIDYNNNTITVKEGNNFKINLMSSLFGKGDVVNVTAEGKTVQYKLQRDQNYARNNMKLYCDPYYSFDSYVTVGNFQPEVNIGYQPKPPEPFSQQNIQNKIPQQVNASIPQQYPQQYPQQNPRGNQYYENQQMQYGYQQPGYQRGYGNMYPGSQMGMGYGRPQRPQMGYQQFPQNFQRPHGYGRQNYPGYQNYQYQYGGENGFGSYY